MPHLRDILRAQFLTDENRGASFVAWNANRFDTFLAAAALIFERDLVLLPYMTRSKSLRGLRIVRAEDRDKRNALGWEFLCGIAMTGLTGLSLDKFTANFAPEFRKLSGAVDFEREEFDPENPQHVAYAWRDSEGLYHAISRAQSIMLETFDEPLSVTMGAACIKIFSRHVPKGVEVGSLIADLRPIVSNFVMRGGFCYCVKRYRGPVWKYDINQAYAAAMRETTLPAGGALHWNGYPPSGAEVFLAKITAAHPSNKIPFYCRTELDGRIKTVFAVRDIPETWITSVEYWQLLSEGWQIDCAECWIWTEHFNMREYVDKLERLRTTCDGGPSGPIGTMVKATGNHSYGKTVEQIEPIQFVLAAECPPDCLPYYGDGSDPLEHVYYRLDEDRKPKAYHQPQIGAFITAYVRMVVRRAALLNPAAWLYADTDCVIFSESVTHLLDIDSKRYGAWKVEEDGTELQIIAKKVYNQPGKNKRSAKGLHVKKLTDDDFDDWFDGNSPVQEQIQLQNFLNVMRGAEMFRMQKREGTRVDCSDYVEIHP